MGEIALGSSGEQAGEMTQSCPSYRYKESRPQPLTPASHPLLPSSAKNTKQTQLFSSIEHFFNALFVILRLIIQGHTIMRVLPSAVKTLKHYFLTIKPAFLDATMVLCGTSLFKKRKAAFILLQDPSSQSRKCGLQTVKGRA